ncbi:MAG TPA: PEP/pyruvate-binding domain-containing protein [candidate division Zixibacteria bacterium]|nr:PEP/pyruvate-binding domain-containing protein [candidate division Zixibacteria bacterium]
MQKKNNQLHLGDTHADLASIREKFEYFHALLDHNNEVLRIISDMEEKAQGEYLFDMNYIRSRLQDLRSGVNQMIDCMIALGGDRYRPLRDRFQLIDNEVDVVFPGNRPVREDAYIRWFDKLNRMHSFSVGSKNAQLGEMKSKLELPVPDGFAITAWAYKHFVSANHLQRRISRRINRVDFRSYEDLVKVSREIQQLVRSNQVPPDLAEALHEACRELVKRTGRDRFSLRSSAIGEDTLFSFAGQYASYLNVSSEQILKFYREVLASKFTPKAIYYFLSHSLSESELSMSVGCVSMIDARSAGVVYSRCPVNPGNDDVMINSLFGLGKSLVDGTLTPDLFRVSRRNGQITEATISPKPVKLVLNSNGGIREEAVPPDLQNQPSIDEKHLRELAKYAIKLEDHYGMPQDIEWAIDNDNRLYLLQTRPLQVMTTRVRAEPFDGKSKKCLLQGGITASHGAGSGIIHHVSTQADLVNVPDGAVLVARHPFPGLITVMNKIKALVTEVGGVASHMATIAREYGVPTLVGVAEAGSLPQGRLVTVDATGAAVYEGDLPDLIGLRTVEYDRMDEGSIYDILGRVLDLISPLRLLHPEDADFTIENCVTFHDITRYIHQRAMEEMFFGASRIEDEELISLRLKTDIPMKLNVIFIDREHTVLGKKGEITEKELGSKPMEAFWSGIKKEGWPSVHPPPQLKPVGVIDRITAGRYARHEYSENSFAILSSEYMIFNVRMGYHLASVEAMCTDDISKNYVRMQFSYGGATLERRKRRIRLITEILNRMEFTCQHKSDFLSATLAYKEETAIEHAVHLLGRLVMMTKQLDMALSSDGVTRWYTDDFIKKLGLNDGDTTTAQS